MDNIFGIKFTFCQEYDTGTRCYSVEDAKNWLKDGKEFYLVGVLEDGNTRKTSQIMNISDDSVFKTFSGKNYKVVGMDEKRLTPTEIKLICFIIGDITIETDPSEIPYYLEIGRTVVANYGDDNGSCEWYTSNIVSIDLDTHTFTTEMEHTYVF